MTDEERGIAERRAAVVEMLARALVRLLLQGNPYPKIPPPPAPQHSQPVEQKELVTNPYESRHVCDGHAQVLTDKGVESFSPRETKGSEAIGR